ncbi:MAG: hypothetical protein P4L74_01895 [Candidatus Doudnabacteria bacterium]|nr:hypothetical protein [Candidatus Doudnabacteria bacterium]
MIDPDLKTELEKLNENLAEIKKKTGSAGIWRSFFNGMFSALGYVAGLAIIVVILGWILQKTGLLKPFEDQVGNFTDLVNSAKKLIPTGQTPSDNQNAQQGSGTPTIVTLPNGQQIQVNLPKGY